MLQVNPFASPASNPAFYSCLKKKRISPQNLNHFGLAASIPVFQNSITQNAACCFIPVPIAWQRHSCLLQFSLLSVFLHNPHIIKRSCGCGDPCDSSKERCCSSYRNTLFSLSGVGSREGFLRIQSLSGSDNNHRGCRGCGASDAPDFKPKARQIKTFSRTALKGSNRALLVISCILPSESNVLSTAFSQRIDKMPVFHPMWRAGWCVTWMLVEEKDSEIGSMHCMFPVVSTLWSPNRGVRKIKTDGNGISQPTEV